MPTFSSLSNISAPIASLAGASLIIIHPIPLMRAGMESALQAHGQHDFARIATYAALEDAETELAAAAQGDVVLIDASLWSAQGGSHLALGAASARGVVVGIMSKADAGAQKLLAAKGIYGVVSPEISVEGFSLAVSELAAGRKTFTKPAETSAVAGLGKLSNRQFEILELMTRGLLNKQIAWELGLTEGTVKSHVSAILEKLGCDRRTQAIATYMQSFGVGSRHAMA